MRTAGERLAAALLARVAAVGGAARIEAQEDAAWSSVTFDGGRHRLVLVLNPGSGSGAGGDGAGEAAEAVAASLATEELVLRGYLVADIAVTKREDRAGKIRLTIAAVTVEAR